MADALEEIQEFMESWQGIYFLRLFAQQNPTVECNAPNLNAYEIFCENIVNSTVLLAQFGAWLTLVSFCTELNSVEYYEYPVIK